MGLKAYSLLSSKTAINNDVILTFSLWKVKEFKSEGRGRGDLGLTGTNFKFWSKKHYHWDTGSLEMMGPPMFSAFRRHFWNDPEPEGKWIFIDEIFCRRQGRRYRGDGRANAPKIFGWSVHPILIKGGRLRTPYYNSPTLIFRSSYGPVLYSTSFV